MPTERDVVTYLLTEAQNNGWTIDVDDGAIHRNLSVTQALDTIFGVDISDVLFKKAGNHTWATLVLGNSPAEVIDDYGINPAFESEVMVKVNAYMDTLQ